MSTPSTRSVSLRRRLLAALLGPVGFVGAFGVAAYVAQGFAPTVQQSHPAAAEEPAEVRLFDQHHCWNDAGDHPAAHSVVATLPGRDEAGIYGQAVTDLAIEQTLFGVDHGLVVHGFCAGRRG